MAGVMIGIDPHKGSHTAFAIDTREKRLGQLRVRASSKQVEVLLGWAAGCPRRIWAIEGARGLGQLLSQQLIAAGERVLDLPPKLAARVRLLDSGQINKNDPVEDYLAGLRLLAGAAGDVDVVIPGHGSVGGSDQVHARIDQDRAYVCALRDAHVLSDPRVGPSATPGWDWVGGVHERQLEGLARRSEHDRSPG
jgi:Transposase